MQTFQQAAAYLEAVVAYITAVHEYSRLFNNQPDVLSAAWQREADKQCAVVESRRHIVAQYQSLFRN